MLDEYFFHQNIPSSGSLVGELQHKVHIAHYFNIHGFH